MRKFVYSSVTLEHHAEDPIYLKGDQSLAFLFFFHFSFVLRIDFGQQGIKSEQEAIKVNLNGM